MTIEIEYEAPQSWDLPYEEIIREVAKGALEDEGCPYEAEVNVLLTDDQGIREMNQKFRGMDKPTDVLSFPMADFGEPGKWDQVLEHPEDCFNPETGELLLGDIVISVDKVEEQAKSYGHSARRELAFLVAHSMLHLFGYDHMSLEDRAVMEGKQRQILDQRGYVR